MSISFGYGMLNDLVRCEYEDPHIHDSYQMDCEPFQITLVSLCSIEFYTRIGRSIGDTMDSLQYNVQT